MSLGRFFIYLSWGVTTLGGVIRYCLNRSSNAWPMVLMTSWAKPSEHSRIWHATVEEVQRTDERSLKMCLNKNTWLKMKVEWKSTDQGLHWTEFIHFTSKFQQIKGLQDDYATITSMKVCYIKKKKDLYLFTQICLVVTLNANLMVEQLFGRYNYNCGSNSRGDTADEPFMWILLLMYIWMKMFSHIHV